MPRARDRGDAGRRDEARGRRGGERGEHRAPSRGRRGRGDRARRRGRRRVGARRLPVRVAPDSFKGTLPAGRVAAAVAAGLRDGGREAVELPVADGGEGTIDALTGALGGERRRALVSDPLGQPIEAEYALIDGGETAVVEMARASGLGLVAEEERDAFAAST